MNMMDKNTKTSIIVLIIIALIAIPIFSIILGGDKANGVSLACQNSEACMAAVKKEEEANRNAAASARSANAFQAKVDELSAEVASKEAEIAISEAEVKNLRAQIKETEARLADEQDALAELLVNMHFESDAEPIRILAGSTSISDLAEKAARDEVVKEQISTSATAVKEAKQKLEADKAEVETLLSQQKQARQDLVVKRSEQKALVEKYENDAEAYAAAAKAALAEQHKAEEEEFNNHPERYGGGTYIGTGGNTYPAIWRNDCPAARDEDRQYTTFWGDVRIGGYVCECTSYAAWKAYETYGVGVGWGHAYSWASGAMNDIRVSSVDHNPAGGTIGQTASGTYGHVFWVESVNADGSINITEYNNPYSTQSVTGSYHWGDFGARTIDAGSASAYWYIHFK